jgi:hypothetical protein
MTRTSIALGCLAFAAATTFAFASPTGALAEPPSYNDDGMHFDAPADFEKLPLAAPADPTGSDDDDSPLPVAVFAYHKGKIDQRVIQITVARFEGRVEAFDVSKISEERKNSNSFVAKNEKTTLQNGMPAYFVKLNAGATAGQYVQSYQYFVCDGTRSIVVAYSGQQGSFDDATAKAALSTLYVVVYPNHRR